MISASKTTFSHFNLKILRPKVTKNIKNLHKKFCEFSPINLKRLQLFELRQFFKVCQTMINFNKNNILDFILVWAKRKQWKIKGFPSSSENKKKFIRAKVNFFVSKVNAQSSRTLLSNFLINFFDLKQTKKLFF